MSENNLVAVPRDEDARGALVDELGIEGYPILSPIPKAWPHGWYDMESHEIVGQLLAYWVDETRLPDEAKQVLRQKYGGASCLGLDPRCWIIRADWPEREEGEN